MQTVWAPRETWKQICQWKAWCAAVLSSAVLGWFKLLTLNWFHQFPYHKFEWNWYQHLYEIPPFHFQKLAQIAIKVKSKLSWKNLPAMSTIGNALKLNEKTFLVITWIHGFSVFGFHCFIVYRCSTRTSWVTSRTSYGYFITILCGLWEFSSSTWYCRSCLLHQLVVTKKHEKHILVSYSPTKFQTSRRLRWSNWIPCVSQSSTRNPVYGKMKILSPQEHLTKSK